MSARLAAEALAAVTGLWPKKPPTISDLLAAEGLEDRWRGRLKKWMAGKQAPMEWAPPPSNQTALQNTLITPPAADEVTAWLTELGDPEVGTEYAAVLLGARDYLEQQWPKIEMPGIVPDVYPLSTDDYAEIWSLVRVLDNPDVLLDELDAWTLTPTQVAAWKATYPELSAVLEEAMTEALASHIVAGKGLSWQQEDVLRVFRGLPPEATISVPAEAPVEEKQPAPQSWEIDFAATRTASENAVAADR